MNKSIDRILRNLSQSFTSTTGIPFEDTYAEANLEYCEALLAFDNTCGTQLSTYVYRRVKNRLINFCKEWYRQTGKGQFMSLDIILAEADTDAEGPVSTRFQDCLIAEEHEAIGDFIQDFVGLGRGVVDAVLQTPEVFEGSSKAMRGQVVKLLREEGWSWPTIWTGIGEVKLVLN